MKIKRIPIFQYILLIIPLLIPILYKLLDDDFVRTIWFYLILYIGLFSGIYALYKLKDNGIKNKWIKIEKIVIILVIAFFAFCIIATILSDLPIQSLIGTQYRREGLFTYIAYFLIIFNSMFICNTDKKKIYQLFVIVGTILSILTLLQLKEYLFYIQYSYNGIFFQFNHFSYFLILALVCNTCLFITSNLKLEKILYFISYVIMLYQLIINNTFGGYLALLITTIFILIYYIFIKKIKLNSIIILITFILLSMFVNKSGSNIVYNNFFENTQQIKEAIDTNFEDEKVIYQLGTTRGRLWAKAIDMIKERPIFGYGIEGIEEEYHKIGMWYADKPHNIIIALIAYIGIPGMLCFFGALGIVMVSILLKIKELSNEDVIAYFACICFLGSSLVANSMFYTTPYFCIFMGIILEIFFKNHIKQLTK